MGYPKWHRIRERLPPLLKAIPALFAAGTCSSKASEATPMPDWEDPHERSAMNDVEQRDGRSRETACLHEAGHALVGVCAGLNLVGLHVGVEPPFGAGVHAPCDHQGEIVALGGLAAELAGTPANRRADRTSTATTRQLLTCGGDIRHRLHWRDRRLGRGSESDTWLIERFVQEAALLSTLLDREMMEPIVQALSRDTWIDGNRLAELAAFGLSRSEHRTLRSWAKRGHIHEDDLLP